MHADPVLLKVFENGSGDIAVAVWRVVARTAKPRLFRENLTDIFEVNEFREMVAKMHVRYILALHVIQQ